LDAKDDEMTVELKEAGYDAYQEAVRSIIFLGLAWAGSLSWGERRAILGLP
jgi:hypothetical protein